MKRRDMFRLIPLAAAGLTATAGRTAFGAQHPACPAGSGSASYGMTYVTRVIEMLEWVRANQSEKILEGAYAIARAIENKQNVWSCWDLGHTNSSDLFTNRSGKPEFLVPGYDFKKIKDGDLVLANFPWPAGYVEDLGKRDLYVIGGPCPWGGDIPRHDLIKENIAKNKIRPFADLWIETNVDHIGAQIKIPGSAAPMAPESGPLNATILWMMVADACRILSKRGIKVAVEGTEEKLSGDKVPWVGLDDPLMDDYFDEVIRQLRAVESEIGNLKKMANMAVDTLTSGGNVYFYSRYYESLAGEAVGRRGGFQFAKGLADGRVKEGKAGDCVIMGTYEPDDEADLKNFDELKKRGLKIASIGPVTRNHQVPEGRTVFRESDIHAGRFVDSAGMFAIEGCNRRVCPTSGSMATSMLWVMSVELAMEMHKRTGTTPGIYYNGALKWSDHHNSQMGAIARERGW